MLLARSFFRNISPVVSNGIPGINKSYICVNCLKRVTRGKPQQTSFFHSSARYSQEQQSEKPRQKVKGPQFGIKPLITWKSVGISVTVGTILVAGIWKLQKDKEDEREKTRRRSIGKSLIGGPWELVNTKTGKVETSKDYEDHWLLIYFGFTHCPDICPDEMDKMCKVAKMLEDDKTFHPVVPLFFTVDPDRDTVDSVKKYCAEFSPKLLGFTGSKEQVNKVARTFRVYHSEGPRDEFEDYIVDHTVIMYLMDPTGQFVDYYGQNRNVEEIVDAIQLQMIKFDRGRKKGWW